MACLNLGQITEGDCESGRVADTVTTGVLRSLKEIEEVRSIWTSWHGHPDSDIDIYLEMLNLNPGIMEPYVIILCRGGHPDAMLIGRITHTRMRFQVGYLSLRSPGVRVLTVVYRGLRGNASAENSRIFVDEILTCLRKGQADAALLEHVRADSFIYSLAEQLPGFLSRDPSPVLHMHRSMTLPSRTEDIFNGLSRKVRHNQRWQAKKFLSDHSGNVTVKVFRDGTDLENLIQAAEEIAKQTYQRGLGVGFADKASTRGLLTLTAKKGWLRAYVLYVGDKPCAFWIGTLYEGTFYSNFMGYDPSYEKYSPGTFLLMRVMENLCIDKVGSIDFGHGDASYKERFGNCDWQEGPIHIFAPTLMGLRLRILRMTAIFDQFMKRTLERTKLLPKIKKIWRGHMMPRHDYES
jgi:hypothetical protein